MKSGGRGERQLKLSHDVAGLTRKYSVGQRMGRLGHDISEKTKQVLEWVGVNGIAGMSDLSKITEYQIREIDSHVRENKIKVGDVVTIDGFEYNIVKDLNDGENIPDGNYYDIGRKKFIVICNSGENRLERSPYRRSQTMIEKKTGKTFGKDDLMISGFVGEIGKILSDEKDVELRTGKLLSSSTEYSGMIGKYDIGIGFLEGEVKRSYSVAHSGCAAFEGNGIFRLDNGITLIGHFNIEHFVNYRKIYGKGKIVYRDGKEEIGYRQEGTELYEKIYKDDEF